MASPAFHITVLGASGGPIEGMTSAYLVKPAAIPYETIITNNVTDALVLVDAGCGISKMAEIIADDLQGSPNRTTESLLRLYSETLTVESYTAPTLRRTRMLQSPHLLQKDASPIQLAFTLADTLKNILITHPHMDHIAALVINSPAFGLESGKHIYGLPETVDALQSHVFNDQIWPNLSSQKNGTFLDFVPLESESCISINDRFAVTPFTVSHGCVSDGSRYHSTAYLLKDITADKRLLVFGDLEADSYCQSENNIRIWEHVSEYIIDGTLRTILIECSTPNLPPRIPLYGHLTPDALFSELSTLDEVLKGKGYAKGVKGLNVLITHVKETMSNVDPRITILRELRELNEKMGLEVEITVVLPGQTYAVS